MNMQTEEVAFYYVALSYCIVLHNCEHRSCSGGLRVPTVYRTFEQLNFSIYINITLTNKLPVINRPRPLFFDKLQDRTAGLKSVFLPHLY